MSVLTVNEIRERSHEIFERHDFVQRSYLFGSYARGEAKEYSDIDFMVESNREVGMEFCSLYDPLENEFRKRVDVLTDREVYAIMPRTFERDKVLIYERGIQNQV